MPKIELQEEFTNPKPEIKKFRIETKYPHLRSDGITQNRAKRRWERLFKKNYKETQ